LVIAFSDAIDSVTSDYRRRSREQFVDKLWTAGVKVARKRQIQGSFSTLTDAQKSAAAWREGRKQGQLVNRHRNPHRNPMILLDRNTPFRGQHWYDLLLGVAERRAASLSADSDG
jgi:hypothetical protein